MHVLGEYPRGHDLAKLYRRVKDVVTLAVSEEALARLSVYYTIARYPNAGLERPSEEITRSQAEEALNTARMVVNEVSKLLETREKVLEALRTLPENLMQRFTSLVATLEETTCLTATLVS